MTARQSSPRLHLCPQPKTLLKRAENPGVELINLTEPVANMIQAVVTDRDGNPIWYYDVGADQANL